MAIDFETNKNIIVKPQLNTPNKQNAESVSVPKTTDCPIDSKASSLAITNNAKAFIENHSQTKKITKAYLKEELTKFKDGNNKRIFSSEDAEEILIEKHDYEDFLASINLIKKYNLKLPAGILRDLFQNEKITSDDIEKKINIFKELLTNPLYKDLKKQYCVESLMSCSFDLEANTTPEQMSKNIELLNTIKTSNPKLYDNLTKDEAFFDLRCVLDSRIDKDTMQNILDSKLLGDELDYSIMLNLLKSETPKESVNKNIEIINFLLSDPTASSLFVSYNRLQDFQIANFLSTKTDPNFDISKKQGVIKLLKEHPCRFIDSEIMLNLITKNNDDTYENGKEFLTKFKKENKDVLCKTALENLSFKEGLRYLEIVKKAPIILENRSYARKDYLNFDRLENLANLLKYSTEKDYLRNQQSYIYHTFTPYLSKENNGPKTILDDPEKCKNVIDKTSAILEALPKTISDNIIGAIFEEVIANNDIQIKPQNLKFLEEIHNDEVFLKLIGYIPDRTMVKFLSQEYDIEILEKNKNLIKEKKDSALFSNHKTVKDLLFWDNDIEKIYNKYTELDKNYHDSLSLKVNKDDNTVTLSHEDGNNDEGKQYISYTYDKDMNLLTKITTKFLENEKQELLIEDKRTNSLHKIIVRNELDDNLSTAEKIISKYFDENGNLVRTKLYNKSSVNGLVNVKEQDYGQKLKVLADTIETPLGTIVEKELTSLDGTKSFIKNHIDSNGNENYTYKIVDKDGKVLLNHNRKEKHIDENTKLTAVNGKEFKVVYNKDSIDVTNLATGEKETINFAKLCPEKRVKSLEKMLKSLPGDELMKLNKFVKNIEFTNSIESSFDDNEQKIIAGTNRFVFLHEFGHAKDFSKCLNYTRTKAPGEISGDLKLQKIFQQEIKNLKENEPAFVNEVVKYFTASGETHYNGELGGLAEAIAEINAMQTTAQSHPMLQMRTQILQEYFPRTIAYLINNHLGN